MAEKNVKRFIRAFLGPVQDLEGVNQSLLINRRLENATGAVLDLLGKLVTQPRNGLDDDTYRRYIRARIATNASDGLVEELIKISHLVIGDDGDAYVHLAEAGTAAITVIIEDVEIDADLASIIISFLREAASAGVRVVLEYWPESEAEMFVFASAAGHPSSVTGEGWGWTGDASVGGALAGSIE